MTAKMQRGLLLCGIFLILCVDRSEACSTGGLVGAIFGTIAVCCLIFGLVLFLLLKKGILKRGEPKKKTQNKITTDAAYTNPAFHGDERDGTGRPITLSGAERGLGGYVPCAEYESPNKDKKRTSVQPNGGVQKASWTPNFKAPGQSMPLKSSSSSHGSLDDTYVTNDPEVVSVSLQSQDFIGLGFNIWGSMRDGVFVSQVHNRGPAIETGKIKPGDRILDITISFANMVYEDALTILSYASPYPVRLHLQKATPDKDKETEGEETDVEDTVHHPVYRSQSMDDVSKIQKERFSFRMRRARSEMKRGSSKKNDGTDTGTLRKWKDMVGLEAAEPSAEANQNFTFTDMNINATDLMADYNEEDRVKTEASVHQYQAPRVLAVDIPDHSRGAMGDDERAKVERLRAQIQQEWNDAPVELVGKSKMNVTAAAAPRKPPRDDDSDDGIRLNSEGKLVLGGPIPGESEPLRFEQQRKDSSASSHSSHSEFDEVGNEIDNDFLMRALKLSEPDSQIVPDVGEEVEIGAETDESMIKLSPARERHSSESSASIISDSKQGKPQANTDAGVEVASTDEYVVVDLANKNKNNSSAPEMSPAKLSLHGEGTAYDETNASMVVNFSEKSLLMKDDPDVPVESGDDTSFSDRKISQNSDEEEMRMLKDYLGDRPFLVDNLGSSDDDQDAVKSDFTVRKTVTVTKVTSDGTTTETTRETIESGDGDHIVKTTSSTVESHGASTDISELSKLKTKALSDAKREIRRRSDSENENQKSDGSTMSSRSSSPHLGDDLDMDLSAIRQKLTMRDISAEPRESSNQSDTDDGATGRKSDSPDIKRRSGGGLTFDITTSEFKSMPDEIEPEPRGEPKGGMAYYVGIDDDLRAPKLDMSDEESIPKPALVRAWDPAEGEPRQRRDSDSSADSHSDHGDAGPGKITFKMPAPSYIEGNNNELPNAEIKHGVNLDMNFNGRSSSLDSTPLGSPHKSSSSEVITKTDSSERFTITSHDEAKGTYTMTLNSLDDSEA